MKTLLVGKHEIKNIRRRNGYEKTALGETFKGMNIKVSENLKPECTMLIYSANNDFSVVEFDEFK